MHRVSYNLNKICIAGNVIDIYANINIDVVSIVYALDANMISSNNVSELLSGFELYIYIYIYTNVRALACENSKLSRGRARNTR